MRRFFWGGLAAFVVIAVTSCDASRIPTAPGDTGLRLALTAASFDSCEPVAQLKTKASVVFGGNPNDNSVLGKLETLRKELDAKRYKKVQEAALDIIYFTLKKNRQQPLAGQAELPTFINMLLCYAGITVQIPAGTSGSNVWLVEPNSVGPDTLLTSDGGAGAVIPNGAVSEPTIITATALDTAVGATLLLTKLDKYPGYYDFKKISATGAPLLSPVVIAVCAPANLDNAVRARLRLGHQGSAGFEITPPADATFLSCGTSSAARLSLSAESPIGNNLQNRSLISGGVGGTTGEFSPFGPIDPLLRASGGVGGTTGEFSRLPVFASSDVAANCPSELPAGSAVSDACRPLIVVMTHLGTLLENVPVTFTVQQGGGLVAPYGPHPQGCGAFDQSAQVLTSSTGKARVCWTLGSTAGTNTVQAQPAVGGDVPAGASFTPTGGVTFTLEGTVDVTPPLVSATLVGQTGNDDWYTSTVGITWSVSDPESGITSQTGCGAQSVASNTSGITFECSAVNGAGLSTTRTVTVKRDASRPTVTGELDGVSGLNGWYTSDVTVDWIIQANGPSGAVATDGCIEVPITTDGSFSRSCVATSGAGLESERETLSGKRDATAPVLTVSGARVSYLVDETISIDCVASDATSGVKSDCDDYSSAAYALSLETHSISFSASDNAGNVSVRQVSFSVAVTHASLCTLTRRLVTDSGIANSLCVKLNAGALNAFINEVKKAQADKKIPSAVALLLIRLAQALQ